MDILVPAVFGFRSPRRGGSGVKYYELTESDDDGCLLPEIHFCHEYKATGAPLSGVALLPPQTLDVAAVEVARVLRLTSTTVEPGMPFRQSCFCVAVSCTLQYVRSIEILILRGTSFWYSHRDAASHCCNLHGVIWMQIASELLSSHHNVYRLCMLVRQPSTTIFALKSPVLFMVVVIYFYVRPQHPLHSVLHAASIG